MFNLIVGVGALTIPLAFHRTGLVLSTGVILFLGGLAFITATWVVEAMGAANAILRAREGVPLADPGRFEMRDRTELGLMARFFLGRRGALALSAVMVLYLLGDLSIYAVSVPLTLADFTGGFTLLGWEVSDPYRFYVVCFALLVVPVSFLPHVQGTKWFQYLTMAVRNVSFFVMIGIAVSRIAAGHATAASDLPMADFQHLPLLIGAALYSFMCHHSIPGFVAPVRNKGRLTALFAADYGSIASAYLLLCYTAVFAYGGVAERDCPSHPGPPCRLQELYTLNFSSFRARPVADFLTLFPVFTLSSNFPLIAITLRANMEAMYDTYYGGGVGGGGVDAAAVVPAGAASSSSSSPSSSSSGVRPSFWRRNAFTLAATLPPILVALATDSVDDLVSITGSVAGNVIQYLAPLALVYASRRHPLLAARKNYTLLRPEDDGGAAEHDDSDEDEGGSDGRGDCPSAGSPGGIFSDVRAHPDNPYASPFQHPGWGVFVALWSAVAFGFAIYNQAKKI